MTRCWPPAEFFQGLDGSRSMSRLIAWTCCVVGCWAALATIVFAFLHPKETGAITVLATIPAAFILNGCVNIVTRNSGSTTGGT